MTQYTRFVVTSNLAKIASEQGKTLYRISKDTGLSMNVLNKYKANKNVSFDKKVIAVLCEYLGVKIEDLIVLAKQ